MTSLVGSGGLLQPVQRYNYLSIAFNLKDARAINSIKAVASKKVLTPTAR
jgi:hypothetical protein